MIATDASAASAASTSPTLSDEATGPAFALQDRFPRAPAWVVALRTFALILAGRYGEAGELLDLAGAAMPQQKSSLVAAVSTYRGRIALAQGRADTAARLLADASVTLRAEPIEVPASWCLSLLAEACALLGRDAEAAEAAREARDLTRRDMVAFEGDEMRARAWVSARTGQVSRACAELLEAAERCASRGQRTLELLALHDALRLGETALAERTAALATAVDGRWAAAIRRHAEAVLADDGEQLLAAAEDFAGMGATLVAAEVFAAAGDRLSSVGRRSESAAALHRSTAAVAAAEGAVTPPLQALAVPARLTRREQEIAQLAARGSTNAQIAAALTISVRTVESHLYSIFSKVGVSNRSELASALARG